jgi:mono/diheme cytochrome c family protein
MTPRKASLLGALVIGVLLLLMGCEAAAKSPAGFRLPDGDAARGLQVALDMRCHVCHRVDGGGLPAPTAEPPVPILLGGQVPYSKTDGELVTSIINPSHKIAPALRTEQVTSGGLSRMPDYGDQMTVRQMIDLVAFLQSRYTVIRPGMPPK